MNPPIEHDAGFDELRLPHMAVLQFPGPDQVRDIEREWSTELGPERFARLKALLFLVWDSPLVR